MKRKGRKDAPSKENKSRKKRECRLKGEKIARQPLLVQTGSRTSLSRKKGVEKKNLKRRPEGEARKESGGGKKKKKPTEVGNSWPAIGEALVAPPFVGGNRCIFNEKQTGQRKFSGRGWFRKEKKKEAHSLEKEKGRSRKPARG